jgi:T5SS/PEP-CTERM-associated repeat protein
MPRPPLPKAEHAWWVWSLALILPLALAPSLPAATVITGDVTPALPWTNSTNPRIGNTGAGTLAVDGGSQLNSGVSYLGDQPGSTGTATVTGAASKWTNGSGLTVGRSGSGALHLEAGGQVSSNYGSLGSLAGSTGTATITGVGSKWTSMSSLFVGQSGSGALTVEDGGHVTADTLYASLGDLHGNGTIASTKGAVLDADLQFNATHPAEAVLGFGAGGALTVTAAGGSLGAGYKGLGRLTISDGVEVSNFTGYLGYRAGSTGTAKIVGAGSKWTNNSVLNIGYSGSGSLRVEAGGEVSSAYGSLGNNSGATGMATITGAGSKWTNIAELWVGNFGSGSLRVEAGGLVSNGYGYLGFQAGSMGTATISGAGSSWTNDSGFFVGLSGSGALRVEAGGQVSSGACDLGFSAGSMGTATITGAGSKCMISSPSSMLVVGRKGSGALTITSGGQVSVRGTLTIDSNGGNDSFVNLATGGMLALWGDADDSLAQFLDLVAGTDAIRYWNAGLANWTPLTAATLGVDYTLQYQAAGDLNGYTLLTVLAPGPAGDFNGDGRVDGADFLAWQRGASPMPNSPEDLATWRTNFGLGAATPATTAVPEPVTLALVALAVASLLPSCRSTRVRQR